MERGGGELTKKAGKSNLFRVLPQSKVVFSELELGTRQKRPQKGGKKVVHQREKRF